MPKFSYNIHFNPFASTIDVNNPYECTPVDRKICSIKDETSCFGCKNLIAKCTHFAEDTKYIDTNGDVTIIPANSTPDEGYCMVTETVSESCNPYHGDLVLVQSSADATESSLICDCKNPGYIGKTSLSGACDDVFVCNGSVVDLNVPFDKITCQCPVGTTPAVKNGIPICRNDIVYTHDYISNQYVGFDRLGASFFNATYGGNTKTEYFRNPCKYCVLTGQRVNGDIAASEDGFQCVSNSFDAMPIRVSSMSRILKGKRGPDAMIAAKIKTIRVYGYFTNTDYQDTGFQIACNDKYKNDALFEVLGLDKTKMYEIAGVSHELSVPGHFRVTAYDDCPTGRCYGSWPSYYCQIRNNFNNSDSQSYQYKQFTNENGSFTIPQYIGSEVPGPFLFKKSCWDMTELKMNPSVKMIENNKLYEFVANNTLYTLDGEQFVPQAGVTMMIIERPLPTGNPIIMFTMGDMQSWRNYVAKMIKVDKPAEEPENRKK